jgi:hypothetical protein
VNGENDKREVLAAIGNLGWQVQAVGKEVGETKEDLATLSGEFKGQQRWLKDLQRRHEEEARSTRKQIGEVDRRVAGLERGDVETTRQRQALDQARASAVLVNAPTPAVPHPAHSLRESATAPVELAKWKAVTAIGVPLVALAASIAAHIWR